MTIDRINDDDHLLLDPVEQPREQPIKHTNTGRTKEDGQGCEDYDRCEDRGGFFASGWWKNRLLIVRSRQGGCTTYVIKKIKCVSVPSSVSIEMQNTGKEMAPPEVHCAASINLVIRGIHR